MTERKRIIVGVAGGIAAYKACTVVRQLTEAGHSVRVVPTESALRFVGAATFEALSGNPVHTGVFDDVHEVPHVRIGQEADLVVVAPATADLLARAVAGRADDLLTATLLTARCPVLFAPAMHTEMWFHPATVDNVATLRRRGAIVLEPASGRLTGADTGAGRLPEAEEITTLAQLLLDARRRAALRPGRRQGARHRRRHPRADRPGALHRQPQFRASRATRWPGSPAQRGADVTLIAGNTAGLIDPAGVDVVHIGSAAQLDDAVSKHAPDAHVLVMAAAVADFRPDAGADQQDQEGRRSERGDPVIELTRTDDVLAGAVRARDGRSAAQHAGHRRVRRGDRRRERRRALPRPRQTAAQGLRSARRQCRRREPGVRGGQQRRMAAGADGTESRWSTVRRL